MLVTTLVGRAEQLHFGKDCCVFQWKPWWVMSKTVLCACDHLANHLPPTPAQAISARGRLPFPGPNTPHMPPNDWEGGTTQSW